MAVHSGGSVDWATVIKPISNPIYTQLLKADVINLVKAILRRYGICF